VTIILLAAWLVAAVLIWRRASEDDASRWLKWLAVVVMLPVASFAVAYYIAKHSRRSVAP
jgi:uncharacterized membrane protein YhdT